MTVATMKATLLVLLAGGASAALPPSPLVWLRPAELPPPGSSVKFWPNAVIGSDIAGATLDMTNCSLGSELCASAPVVGELSSGARIVNFTGPGMFGLGQNLIVGGDYSNTSYSVFFASATVPGIAGQRILGQCGARGPQPPTALKPSCELTLQQAATQTGSSARGGPPPTT